MQISLEEIHQPEQPEDQPEEQPKEEPQISSVQRKRENKLYKCNHCGKSMNRKTLLYSHNCMNKQTKPEKQIDVPAPVVREIVREVHKEPEITDQHIEDYINRKKQAQLDRAKQDRQARFNKLMANAF